MEKKIPFLMKMAIAFNIVGTIALSLSLIADTPFKLVVTLNIGSLLLLGGFLFWVALVILEAIHKGMFK